MRHAILISTLVVIAAAACYGMSDDDLKTFTTNLSDALLDIGLTPDDSRIRHDYATPDSFRLPLIDSLMYEPTTLLYRVDGIAARIESDTSLTDMMADLWGAMSVEILMLASPKEGTRIRDLRGNLAHLPPEVSQPIAIYLDRIETAALVRSLALEPVTQGLDFLRDNAPFLVTPRQEYEDVNPLQLDSLETADTALGDSVLHLSEQIEVPLIASMSLTALEAAEHLASHLEGLEASVCSPSKGRSIKRYNGGRATFGGKTSTVTGKILYMAVTEWGPIAIGDSSKNTYDGPFALVIDLGGDDIYNLTYNPKINFDLILDMAGNDLYRSADDGAVAGAIFGTSIVMDLAGNDTYQAADVSLGAGIYGAGVLDDRAGDDTYTSGAFSQGAGFLGVGLLSEGGGNDCYLAEAQSQAFGSMMGGGLLIERGGNDTYLTNMSQTDILRYDDHYLSLSQGCAFGYRPDYSGGIGLLIDSSGNDLYSSDIFGQGVGYWYCVGALIDRAGHDRYSSYQYAQGSGIHLAFGLLLDQSGNDYYVSKGVSQGCGHDLALGLLADFSGNDCYTAVDLSQGAGSANGTGILYDADGVDAYSSKSKVNVSGYGDYRREFGSIGLAIDVKGDDFYSARGENESLWESGRYGLGIDIPGQATNPRGDIVVNDYPFEERTFTTAELYVLAMRAEPRFREWKTYAFDKMVADSVASIEYLRTVLDTKDATKRHATKDILVKIGVPAVPMLCDETTRGNDLAKAEASWILGLIENAGAFDALMGLSRSKDWKHRSGALNSLARLKGLRGDDEQHLRDRLAEVLRDSAEVFYVTKDAAFAAGNRKYCDLVPLLVDCLDHAHYSVRYSAAEALRQMSSQAVCPTVADLLIAKVPSLTLDGLIAGIYAGGDLSADSKLALIEAALSAHQSQDLHVAVALARLAATLQPGTPQQRRRLESLSARLPQDSWEIKALAR